MAIKLKIGSPVVGEDFFGREVELKKAESLIRDNNLMLAAPRRVGKTRDEIYNHIYAKIPTFENDEMGLLLRALMTDGYLVRDNEQYKFRSPLLRDYWKETYC